MIISSLKSSCLAICSSLHASVHCRLFFLYGLSKKLAFVPVASAITAIHRDCQFPMHHSPTYSRWSLEVKSFLLIFHNGWTTMILI